MDNRNKRDKHFSLADDLQTACYVSDSDNLSQISVEESQTYSTTSLIDRADAPERTQFILPTIAPITVKYLEKAFDGFAKEFTNTLIPHKEKSKPSPPPRGRGDPKPPEKPPEKPPVNPPIYSAPPSVPPGPIWYIAPGPQGSGYPPVFQSQPQYVLPGGYPQAQIQPQVPPGYRYPTEILSQPQLFQYVLPPGYPQPSPQQQIPVYTYGVPNGYPQAQIQPQVPQGYGYPQVPGSIGQNPLPSRSKNRVSCSYPTRPASRCEVPNGYPQAQIQPQVPPGYGYTQVPSSFGQNPLPLRSKNRVSRSYPTRHASRCEVPNRYPQAQIQPQVPPGYGYTQVPSSIGQNPLPSRSKNRVSCSPPTRPSGSKK